MIIYKNIDGFIEGYVTEEELKQGQLALHGNITFNMEECPNFPEDQPEAWEHFQENFKCYTFHPVSPEYWVENFGEDYEIPSADIVSQFVYHPEREEAILDELREEIRRRREIECFPIINRGEAWYATLTEEQKAELQVWYQAWLDAPQTLVVPEKPEWLK